MGKCNEYFNRGYLTTVMDGGAGSSGKGKLASYLMMNADNVSFACNTFHPQAGHWVKLRDGRSFFYQTLNSSAFLHEKLEKIYLGPGSIIELPALLREMEENGIPRHKIGISPIVPILQAQDKLYEEGKSEFDSSSVLASAVAANGTNRFGSTCHGVGSSVARRALRRPSLILAKDVPELRDMVCDVPGEILARLKRGQAGMLELAQGYQLSLMHQKFFPYVTSRNVTVAQGLSDMMLPTHVAGQVILNFRTYPIRINNNKYVATDGTFLTWEQVKLGVEHAVVQGNSGPGYDDQKELSWDEVTKLSGSPSTIMETTSVTKLPRRVFTFSRENLVEALNANDTGRGIHISINFMNYVDAGLLHKDTPRDLSRKALEWLQQNVGPYQAYVKFLGTGPMSEDTILCAR